MPSKVKRVSIPMKEDTAQLLFELADRLNVSQQSAGRVALRIGLDALKESASHVAQAIIARETDSAVQLDLQGESTQEKPAGHSDPDIEDLLSCPHGKPWDSVVPCKECNNFK